MVDCTVGCQLLCLSSRSLWLRRCCCCCCCRVCVWLAQYWEISLRYVRQRIILRSRVDGRKSNTGERARSTSMQR